MDSVKVVFTLKHQSFQLVKIIKFQFMLFKKNVNIKIELDFLKSSLLFLYFFLQFNARLTALALFSLLIT